MNDKEKQYCNYQPKFTGKGLKIGVIETMVLDEWIPKLNEMNIKIPLSIPNRPLVNDGSFAFPHPIATCSIIRDMLPEAEIYLLPVNYDTYLFATKNKLNIISMSVDRMPIDDNYEQIMSNRTLLLCSGGNKPDVSQESTSAQLDFWTSISAVHLVDNKPQFADYSAYGLGKIDFTSFSNLESKYFDYKLIGTSFSVPFTVGLIGQYYEAYYNKFGFYPFPDEAKWFMEKHSHPVVNDKLKEGFGLFILPNLDEYNFGTVMQIGNPTINVNGEIKTYKAPITIEGSSYVPISMLRLCGKNDGKVFWHNETKHIIVV